MDRQEFEKWQELKRTYGKKLNDYAWNFESKNLWTLFDKLRELSKLEFSYWTASDLRSYEISVEHNKVSLVFGDHWEDDEYWISEYIPLYAAFEPDKYVEEMRLKIEKTRKMMEEIHRKKTVDEEYKAKMERYENFLKLSEEFMYGPPDDEFGL